MRTLTVGEHTKAVDEELDPGQSAAATLERVDKKRESMPYEAARREMDPFPPPSAFTENEDLKAREIARSPSSSLRESAKNIPEVD